MAHLPLLPLEEFVLLVPANLVFASLKVLIPRVCMLPPGPHCLIKLN